MKCLALDKKTRSSKWRKRWNTLSTEKITVFECDDKDDRTKAIESQFLESIADQRALVLIHHEPCNDDCADFVKRVEELNKERSFAVIYVMYVGGSGLTESSEQYWIHYSRTQVGTGGDLSHLAGKFSRLFNGLENASEKSEVLVAWKYFDRGARSELSELIEIVAPLLVLESDTTPKVILDQAAKEIDKKDDEWKKWAVLLVEEVSAEILGSKLDELCDHLKKDTGNTIAEWAVSHSGEMKELARGFL